MLPHAAYSLQIAALKEAATTSVDIIMDPSSVHPSPLFVKFEYAYHVFYDLTNGRPSGTSLADWHEMILDIVTGSIAASASKWTAHLRATEDLSVAKNVLYMPRYKLIMDVLMYPARKNDSLADDILACFEEAWEHLPESPVVSRLGQRFEDEQIVPLMF